MIIEFRSVSKSYNSRPAVMEFSLEVAQSERVAILGPSGCGKTTVLRMLAGLVAPDAGSIVLDGTVVAAEGRVLVEPEDRNLGLVFQDLALWPHLTVKGNLEFGLQAKGVSRGEREQRIGEVLDQVQMGPYLKARPGQLSGGQQQRVALARSLVLRPQALLMDEPLSNLDLELNLSLRQEIIQLQQRLGFTLLYVTHDREEAFDLATRVVVMAGGRISQVGSAEAIREYFRGLYRSREGPGQ
jgi:ABC-type Fe3+/spermidine/putrescine transport system ATPase subunit